MNIANKIDILVWVSLTVTRIPIIRFKIFFRYNNYDEFDSLIGIINDKYVIA